MFKIIITVDYEIHGNGDGDPYDLMIEPTDRMLKLFDKYGAKLSIMADVAEIIKFREYYERNNEDKYHYREIQEQLQRVVKSDHDVQLHIHSGYIDAVINSDKLHVNWDDYNLCLLPVERIDTIIKTCKEYLLEILAQVKSDYKCIAFRAANWSMMPTNNIYNALLNNGIYIDTSVFKYGKRSNKVRFDYNEAHDALMPWRADENNICQLDKKGRLIEIPIYCEKRHFVHFVSFIRIFRFVRARFHKHEKIDLFEKHGYEKQDNIQTNTRVRMGNIAKLVKLINKKMAWKMDINQATGRQLIKALRRIERNYSGLAHDIPIVLIGHSKSFIKYNERTLEPFLEYIAKHPHKYVFSTFANAGLQISEVEANYEN